MEKPKKQFVVVPWRYKGWLLRFYIETAGRVPSFELCGRLRVELLKAVTKHFGEDT